MNEKIINILLLGINYIFNPLLLATFSVIIVFNSGHYLSVLNSTTRDIIYSIFFISTFLLPLLFISILYYFGLISSITNQSKVEIIIILATVAINYALAYYFMNRIHIPAILLNIILASLILVIVAIITLIFKKISIYSLGWGALTALVLFLAGINGLKVLNITVVIILISGVVASIRLYLNKNTPFEIYSGYILGFIVFYFSSILLS